jgi:hypothetical protein
MVFMAKMSEVVPFSQDDRLVRAGFPRQLAADMIPVAIMKLRGTTSKINPLHFSFRHFWKLI